MYLNKAELNDESYQILKYFTKLKEYRVIAFSTAKDYEQILNEDYEVKDVDVDEFIDKMREFVKDENKKRVQALENAKEK